MDGEITTERLRGALENGETPRLVDIRQPGPFRRGHIPGSENIPLARLPREVDSLDGADHVVTICPHGKASIKAARLIASWEGFDGRVESLAGGLEAWDGPLAEDEPEADDDRETPF